MYVINGACICFSEFHDRYYYHRRVTTSLDQPNDSMPHSFRPAVDTSGNYVHMHSYHPTPAPRHLTDHFSRDVTDHFRPAEDHHASDLALTGMQLVCTALNLCFLNINISYY